MSTSGTVTFNFNRNQIILAAMRKIKVIASGETPSAQLVQDFSDQLNTFVKSLDATGLHLWTETEATLFLQAGQVAYSLGGSADNCAETFTATTVATAVVKGVSSVIVASATGTLTTYNIGIVLDGGSIFWTTVNGAPSGATVTLTAPTTDSAAVGNPVYVYQTNIVRPLRVLSARRYNFPSALDTQMIPLSRIDYRNMPDKTDQGVVTQWFYDPKGGANAMGRLHVWPAPSDSTNAVKFTWMRPIQDFLTSANNPDLPQEWLDPLVWNLAYRMAPEFPVPSALYSMVKEQATLTLQNVMGFDREPESYFFGFSADQTR
jgi:hypothetical protein